MKKLLAFAFAAILSATCVAFAACSDGEESVSIDEVKITAPASTEIKAGEKFTLEYTILPAESADDAKVEWEISDSTKLSYANGEFTALTCGNVTVTAHVKDSQVTDKIDLKVTAPNGYTEFIGNGYSLVYPSLWNHSLESGVDTWNSMLLGSTANMNVTTEELNPNYFSVTSGELFQTTIEAMFELSGATVTFDEPVTVEKTTYLGVERLQVNYLYTVEYSGIITLTMHQTQLIINNEDANLTCILTVTYSAEEFDEAAAKLQQTVFSQFMPA